MTPLGGSNVTDKRCPRCGGALIDDYDMHGTFKYCLQCGNHIDSPAASTASEETLREGTRYRTRNPSSRWGVKM